MPDTWTDLKKSAKLELDDGQYFLRKAKRSLSKEDAERAKGLFKEIQNALKTKDEAKLAATLKEYSEFKRDHFSAVHFNKTWETVKELLWIVIIVLTIRWLLIEPFRIPSGSMIPNLLVGDQLMVNKLTYGWMIPFTTKKLTNFKTPKRGDVIVFKFPDNPREDYVKRVIGVPGDEVSYQDSVLYINGKEVTREYVGPYNGPTDHDFCPEHDLYVEALDGVRHDMILCRRSHTGDSFDTIKVPPGKLWAMGDNRDNSSDSRVWGFVPIENIKGRALFIHLPLDPDNHYLPKWGRFFKVIK
jgi:signal peptidase I